MTGLFRRRDGLEHELRAERPSPSEELVSRIEARLREATPLRRRGSLRLALPVTLTAGLVIALATVGGVSYAATSVESAAKAVVHTLAPANANEESIPLNVTAGGDQYKPGYGWGDPNHVHTGPPGLTVKGTVTPHIVGTIAIISTKFTIDEQAHLWISIIDKATGKKLVIVQNKSKVGGKLHGRPYKTPQYLVLVPRTIPLTLAMPSRLLVSGVKYEIKILARSPLGDKKTLLIPFSS